MPDLTDSRAYQMLRVNPDLWQLDHVRIQFLKDWVKAPPVKP